MSASGTVQTNWTGTWHGTLQAYPEGEIGAGWNTTLEIGPYPMFDGSCTMWRGIFKENGTIKLTKDNRFCRGHGPDDLYFDNGGGGKIAVQWIHNVLVSPFKYNGVFVVASMRMREDILEEEILITGDNPAVQNVTVSIRAHSIHIKTMRRMSMSNSGEKSFRSPFLVIYALFFLRFGFLLHA
ncbi:unnamed protein product [Rotaria socialis]|nr:unnamed protein product [Rotaria socialis]CAF4302807.1 unnamed protein product [Rotaria socialis]CAF4530335.1 unnamed protein product [Rotaria socialis]CAF4542966.1 unnamed protein product [Rotaria socialis]